MVANRFHILPPIFKVFKKPPPGRWFRCWNLFYMPTAKSPSSDGSKMTEMRFLILLFFIGSHYFTLPQKNVKSQEENLNFLFRLSFLIKYYLPISDFGK